MDFDSIVIGGGHAGIEAALILARMGKKTLLITQNLDTIGKLSCNPAVGGLAKGNMVREIDALGGQMGKLIDATMIQFRILNRSKGPAVQSPRAQADKYRYQELAKRTLELEPNLSLFMDTVIDLLISEAGDGRGDRGRAAREISATQGNTRKIAGVITERSRVFHARTVVMTTGTFLNGTIFIGEHRARSGRLGEPSASGLEQGLRNLGFSLGRMKTGTPARIHKASLDFDQLEEQFGENDIVPFSFSSLPLNRPNLACYITYTQEKTHEIIRQNMHRSPLYSGEIVGLGPRYCPSIEDKVVKFPHRERHQIFIEPEGGDTEEMYLNGMSSSLPEDVQEDFIHSLPGLNHAYIMRPGYAVEYDYLDPSQLYPSLETKNVAGLFVAGQTNGTSGYEEAAAQGLLAGINAGQYLGGEEALVLARSQAYIGVMIDDLVTKGTREPYRMFTSRAEHRIALRHDSADARLLPIARRLGLIKDTAWIEFTKKTEALVLAKETLAARFINEKDLQLSRSLTAPSLDLDAVYKDGPLGKSFLQVVKSPRLSLSDLLRIDAEILKDIPKAWLQQLELDVKYEGYIKRQDEQVARFARMETTQVPLDFDYDSVPGFTNEAREKFKKIRPFTIGQAARIPGIRNGDVAILLVSVSKHTTSASAESMLNDYRKSFDQGDLE